MTTETRAVGGDTIVSYNPATCEPLAELACATADEVHDAVFRAKEAQPRWQALPVAKRVAMLRNFQQLLREQRDDVARLICREAGKPAAEALATEVLVVLDAAQFCINKAHEFLRPQPVPHGNIVMNMKRGKLLRDPYGVIGIIAP